MDSASPSEWTITGDTLVEHQSAALVPEHAARADAERVEHVRLAGPEHLAAIVPVQAIA